MPTQPETGKRVRRPPLAQGKKGKLREAGLLDVCYRWAQGCCKNAACRYSHRPLKPSDLQLFEELLDTSQGQPEEPSTLDDAAAGISTAVHAPPTAPGVALNREGKMANLPIDEASSGGPAAPTFPLVIAPLPVNNSCKLSAPRPPASFRKGLKVESSGSTILRHKLGDCKGRDAAAVTRDRPARSVNEQPCAYARPAVMPKQCVPHRWYRVAVRKNATSTAPSIKVGAKWGTEGAAKFPRSSYVTNPPGTRPKSSVTLASKDVSGTIKGELIKQSVFRRAWADMSDSSQEEEDDNNPFEVPRQAESSQGISAPPNVSKPLSGTRQQQRRLKHYAFWKLRKMHRYMRHEETGSNPQSSFRAVSISQPLDSQGEANVSRVVLDSVWTQVAKRQYCSPTPLSFADPGLQADTNSRGVNSVAPLPNQTSVLKTVRTGTLRGRSPTSKSLRGSSKPVLGAKHAVSVTLTTSVVRSESPPIARSDKLPVVALLTSEKREHLQTGELQTNQRAFFVGSDWISRPVPGRFETALTQFPRCRSLTLKSFRFRPEPIRGPELVEPQDPASLQSTFDACQQTGECHSQQMVPPGTVCLETGFGPSNVVVGRPEAETCSSGVPMPRSRSLSSGLPLVFHFASSGGARHPDGTC